MSITIGIKLDEEIRDRLKSLGTDRQCFTHLLMREAIREYLEREEVIETRNREADDAWADYKRSGKFVSHEAMKPWLHGSILGGLIKRTMRQRLNVDAEMVGNRLGGSAKTAPVY